MVMLVSLSGGDYYQNDDVVVDGSDHDDNNDSDNADANGPPMLLTSVTPSRFLVSSRFPAAFHAA